jgi:multidrug efflux pump subunit AcrA (membrane-fusion protein)
MSAPLSTSGGRRGEPEPHAWQELEEVFGGLSELARAPIAPQEFYQSLLDEVVRALSAVGGVVWLRAGNGYQTAAQTRLKSGDFLADPSSRQAHDALLADVADNERVACVMPQESAANDTAIPTDHTLLIGPVRMHSDGAGDRALAIIELALRSDASPATYRGCEQFLTAVCELAGDFHAFAELRRLRGDEAYRTQLLQLSEHVHRQLTLSEVGYVAANEGRRVAACDRLSVVMARGPRCRLIAASGVSRIERRSGAARRIEQLADLVRRTREPAFYADGHSDALPPVAEMLEQHSEESDARRVVAVPLFRPQTPADSDSALALDRRAEKNAEPLFVLVAEQFEAGSEPQRDRIVEVAAVCATALYNARDVDRLPFQWLLRPLGSLKEQVATHIPRTAFVVAAVAASIAALAFVKGDFTVEAPGTLQPTVQRDVFAPRSGLVEEVLVAHGTDVAAGQPLVRLRDPSLDMEIKRVDGEVETVQRQLDAVRATRTNRQIRDANPADAYRLSAEERELEQRLANARRELELLVAEQKQLVVTSPMAGRILTWDLAQRLGARPVERGEVLVTVADLNSGWHLELAVPDDRIGYVLAAQQELQPDLDVRFRLSSDDRELHTGRIQEISRTADVREDESTMALPTVTVKVAFGEEQLRDSLANVRPGVSARAQIECGQRPIGYVWFHDIWDAAIEWLRF